MTYSCVSQLLVALQLCLPCHLLSVEPQVLVISAPRAKSRWIGPEEPVPSSRVCLLSISEFLFGSGIIDTYSSLPCVKTPRSPGMNGYRLEPEASMFRLGENQVRTTLLLPVVCWAHHHFLVLRQPACATKEPGSAFMVISAPGKITQFVRFNGHTWTWLSLGSLSPS